MGPEASEEVVPWGRLWSLCIPDREVGKVLGNRGVEEGTGDRVEEGREGPGGHDLFCKSRSQDGRPDIPREVHIHVKLLFPCFLAC